MKKAILILVVILFAISNSFAGAGNKYGKKLTLKEKTKISTILENPKDFVDKKVLIEGTVVRVCEKRG